MTIAEAENVRELLLDTPSVGVEEIGCIEAAIASNQGRDVRQYVQELLRKAIQGDASPRDVLVLGVTSYLLADHKTADAYLSQLHENGTAEFYHAHALMALERYDDAAEKFAQAAQHGWDSVDATLARAGAIRLSGRLDEAEELLRNTAREGAMRADYSYQMGCILADRGDSFGAIEYFERAVDMDPQHSGVLFRLACQNDLMGNDQEAVNLYERSLSKPPFFLGALINLGLLYEDDENYSAAGYCFHKVLECCPNHARAQLYLKDIEASGDMYFDEEATRREKELEQVLKIPITDFELSARSRNSLEIADIHTLGDLTRVTEQQLLEGKNFGETSLREVLEILETHGLRIGQYIAEEFQASPAISEVDSSPQDRAAADMPVSELNLSVRARKCVARLGITGVGELVSKSPDNLLSVRNFGVTSLNEIRSKLAEIGLSLRGD